MSAEPKRRALGRGLSALLDDDDAEIASLDPVPPTRELPIELLIPNPDQPRVYFDSEREKDLIESISARGILQPILVRPDPQNGGAYQIIAGERRWRAAQKASLHAVPVIIKELDDGEVLEVALIENVQRQDLTPIEEAKGYFRLIEDFTYTQEQLSRVIGKSRSHIANTLRLLTLPESVISMVASGQLSAGHARALIPADNVEMLAHQVVGQALNVRQTEKLVRRSLAAQSEEGTTASGPSKTAPVAQNQNVEKDADILALENELATALGMHVEVLNSGEAGQVCIHYQELEQLDEICQRLTLGAHG